MDRLVECVPNFSEGRDRKVIDSIVDAIASEAGVAVLNVDSGEAANRTVVTFAGSPEAVCEAAFRGAARAQELIDMRRHHGTHPRNGATDVLPLVPVSGITLEECAELARNLARRMYEELGIPCYCYEASAFRPERRNLAVCRAGEYESLPERFADPSRRPDFCGSWDEQAQRSGASTVGARNFLIAVNFNLDTKSVDSAMDIACEVREKGRKARVGDSPDGALLKDAAGKQVWIPGKLRGVKAIGWYIEEYGIAQVSMNITDIDAAPLHVAYEEVSRAAAVRGLRVTGTEIIGLVPQKVLLDAGSFYLSRRGCSDDIGEDGIMQAAVESMGLDDLRSFDPREKVIEFMLKKAYLCKKTEL